MRILTVLLLTSGWFADASADDEPLKTLHVCEILRDPSAFNGKIIAVRGVYLAGGHGLYLSEQDCKAPLVTKTYRWPSVIWVPLSEKEFQTRGLSFQRALKAEVEIGNARRGAEERRPNGIKIEKVTVTYVGLFETHAHFDDKVVQRPDGSQVGIGFGQVPGAPGQLFVDTVKDIVVEFQPASDHVQR
jgi:hypothetical protein